MIGVVLDTNVVVSANIRGEGLEAFVVSLCLTGRLTLYLSEPILAEYERVLSYPRLKFQPEATSAFLKRVRQAGVLISPKVAVAAAKHEPDNRFLECAQTAGAPYLITGNLRHFPSRWKGTQVVNSRRFLDFFLDQVRTQN